MTGADPTSGPAWSPNALLAGAALAWFLVVVPLAAWLESRAQRRATREGRPGVPPTEGSS